MSKRANPTVVGAFALGAAAIAVIAVVVLGGGHFLRRPVTFVMAFDSVAGLSPGSPVLARGVQVGSVTRIVLGYRKTRVAVYADFYVERVAGAPSGMFASRKDTIERLNTLIARGLRAQLQTQSLVTGQLNVSLEDHAETPAVITGIDPDYPEIPTIPTQLALLQDQLKRVIAELEQIPFRQIATSTLSSVEAIERMARSPEITRALTSFTSTMQAAQALAKNLDQRLGPAAESLQGTVSEARKAVADITHDLQKLLQNVDAQVAPLTASIGATSDTARVLLTDTQRAVRDVNEQIVPLAVSLRATSDAARETLLKAQAVLGGLDGVLDEGSPLGYQLAQMLEELTRAARATRTLSEEIDRQPNILIFGRGTASP